VRSSDDEVNRELERRVRSVLQEAPAMLVAVDLLADLIRKPAPES
jgi:hypothetical protein